MVPHQLEVFGTAQKNYSSYGSRTRKRPGLVACSQENVGFLQGARESTHTVV
jgi:hypothetical protein